MMYQFGFAVSLIEGWMAKGVYIINPSLPNSSTIRAGFGITKEESLAVYVQY
jgi:hypothetical protein